MADKSQQEDTSEQDILDQAENALRETLELLGLAREEFWNRVRAGDFSDVKDVTDMCNSLDRAWHTINKQRLNVAERSRKLGLAVGGDLDLEAARASVCEQLDCIAAALQAG